ncbi:MAG: thiamine pyrophosphate-dependent dehydrogenase E1 component subunit alpha, partial [Armatimonadetes bacterium]|nr:thiamine pyrophosphate-dependent dehydrogenase E1 component subunit alpha [Armatimonadota bacterium]
MRRASRCPARTTSPTTCRCSRRESRWLSRPPTSRPSGTSACSASSCRCPSRASTPAPCASWRCAKERSIMETERMLEWYRRLYLLRRFDEMCLQLKYKDLIMNGFHPYSGEEAVAVGVCDFLRPDDVVFSTHRPQGHSLARGSTPRQVFCEMLGRRGGMSQGIGGPMQWIDAPNRFFCGAIVGSGITVATGVGLALKRAGQGQVCVCFFGDGASNTGSFHEGLNLAAIWKLPVLYVCENNQYGEAMPVAEFVSGESIAARGAAYGIHSVKADGMDLVRVLEATACEIGRCRGGDGPALIEFETYRFRGHYGGDPEHTYR